MPLPAPPDDPAAVARLLALLDLAALGGDRFEGAAARGGWQRVFGGQVVAQALVAASRTVDADRLAHSLHAYFIRPGDPAVPIVYAVERTRDGRSFATRRVVAAQQGRAIFDMVASFQTGEPGLAHAAAMPAVAAPETLPSEYDEMRRTWDATPEPWRTLWGERDRPFEFRGVEGGDGFTTAKRPPVAHNWFRLAAPVAADPALARALLAYASDFSLLDTCLLPHGVPWSDPALQVASLDHALWFHGDPPLADWLLFAQDSPVSGGGRGLNRGTIFARDGRLIASAVQEGLIRYRAPDGA